MTEQIHESTPTDETRYRSEWVDELRRSLKRDTRIAFFVVAVPIFVLTIVFSVFGVIHFTEQREAQAAALTNTKLEHRAELGQALMLHSDGSFYAVGADENGNRVLTYSTTGENGDIVTRSVADRVSLKEDDPSSDVVEVDLSVKTLDPADDTIAPYVSIERCKVVPIDASKPVFEGDPREFVTTEPGTGLSRNEPFQLCKDRVTFWVPADAVQPE